MKIKLEKPVTLKESLLKKEALTVEQKLEKKSRKKSITLTEQESRLIEQDKKQEVAIRKQVRTPRRKTIETTPKLPKIDTWPIDEKEQNNHEKDPVTAFAPENIPVEPEVFEFTEPEQDVYARGNEYPTPDEEREQLEMIDQHNLETFGTKDQSKIGMILAEKYLNNEADVETLPPNPDFPLDNFDKYNFQTQQVHPQRSEKVHGNGAREGQRQGFLNKIKNFWLELKADTKSIAEELGWDEEKELEKQAHEYKNHLKETPTRPDQDYYDLDKAA